jgi:hypothetical protein
VVKAVENIFGGEPTLNSYDGNGQYTAFIDGGGGGGGGYTPPVQPNPTYVPSSYTNQITNNSILVNLISNNGEVAFIENGATIGYGVSFTSNYSPASNFNGVKRYDVEKNGWKATTYYEVEVTKTYQQQNYNYYNFVNYQPIIGFNSLNQFNNNFGFNYNYNYNFSERLTAIDYNYSETLTVREFTLEKDGSYKLSNTNNFNFGTVSLNFNLEPNIRIPDTEQPPIDAVEPKIVPIEILFSSNFKEELIDNVKLTYIIFDANSEIVNSGEISLRDGNVYQSLSEKFLNGRVDFKLEYVNKPNDYSLTHIYQKSNTNELAGKTDYDFSTWNQQNSAFSLPAKQLSSGISIVALFEKEIQVDRPIISLDTTQYSIHVKDSDLEKEVQIPFRTSNTDNVRVYIDGKADTLLVPASNGFISLFFQKDFSEVYGTKKIVLVAESNQYGTGDSVTALITFTAVNDFPSITEISYTEEVDIPSFSDFNIDLSYEYITFATSTVDVDLLVKDGSRITLFKNLTPNGNISINIKTLREKYTNWSGSNNITLIFKPFNRSGSEELIGNEYEIKTNLIIPSIQLDENIFSTSIFNAFFEKLKIIEPEKESKYLSHLANFGNDEQLLISTWENDNWTLSSKKEDELGNIIIENEIDSILLKLYEPLPTTITPNSTFWITKLMANPLVETIVLTQQADILCPPLKGPNFNIDVDYVKGNSTNFESLDNLILSSSVTNTELVATYLSSSLFDDTNLNIEYASGSEYLWSNFIHFSSAKERVDNFVYKVQLIEAYDKLILSASTNVYGPGFNPNHTASLAAQQEVERQSLKKNQLVNGFDGFEKFLYTSSSLSWPYTGNVIELNTSNEVKNWYNNIIELAEVYDNNNQNYILNNVPQYILSNENNDSLLLFFSMIGQHFDTIYYHTKSIERSRGLGYKQKGGISDKLLFDTLKSFSWDAKNLAADSKLWSYVFGTDNNEIELNPAKKRTSEVWKRIINNLPYLLKHKGTRRGIYALMACYGIPSSNLSILEFGGPEVSNGATKSKLVMDNVTTALSLTNGASLKVDWIETDLGRKPDTIEFFLKPKEFKNSNLISGSGWDVSITTSSVDSDFGNIELNISASTKQTISIQNLPIFNGRFFGVEVVRSGSAGSELLSLNVRQSEKERTIFEQSNTLQLSNGSNWESGSHISIGNDFVGSLDEFRLWETPLDKERFYEHVSFPEMINGNHISSSTDDLFLRLDFEFPKNLDTYRTIPNVDTNIYFSGSLSRNDYESGSTAEVYSVKNTFIPFVTASNFTPQTSYPHNFEVVDRTIVLEIPDLGAGRYSTNKVRFESQELVFDLSSKSRATKKAFDQSPTDSNRVGLFFSPTKELNFDIAKSLGGVNLDNYIGDPSDRYNSTYKRLDSLRNYYFERFDGRDIYAYINLIKLYEKSMFEDIKKMLPARVKATTGLLIEPHILERSKHQHKKPTGEHNDFTSSIQYGSDILSGENIQEDAYIDANADYTLSGDSYQYDVTASNTSFEQLYAENYQQTASINADSIFTLESDYYQEETTIDAGLGDVTITTEIDLINSNIIVGQNDFENIGFGIYAESGSAIRTYYDKDGKKIKERVRVQLVKETKTRSYTYLTGSVGISGLYTTTGTETYTETKLNIQPFSGSNALTSSSENVKIVPLNGYLKSHYRNTSDLTRGLQNSFYNGSKNTAASTLDGTPPVEIFLTNPNTLRVNKTNRDASEPILEVE